jgi:cytidylate kinase
VSRTFGTAECIRPIYAAIRSVPIPTKGSDQGPPQHPAEPFITISRQCGAGAWTLAQQLVPALNALDPAGRPWTCWDRELVSKVATDYHIPQHMIEALGEANYSWLADMLGSLSYADSPAQAEEARIYARVANTIRTLAQSGRVIIVGRGGVFITRRMPGGLHVRLVAPFEQRVAFMARQLNLSERAATRHVREADHAREAFYRRHWPGESLAPETFDMVLNTAQLDTDALIQVIVAVVRARLPVRAA